MAHSRFNKFLIAALQGDLTKASDVQQGNTCVNVLDVRSRDGLCVARALNLRAAGESLVLLRNPTVGGRAVLPLQKGGRVAVVGPHANATAILVQLDSGMICPDDTMACVESPAAAIRRHNGGGSVVVKQGHGLFDSATDDNTTVADALAAAAAADVVVLGAGIAQCAGHGHGVRRVSAKARAHAVDDFEPC